MDIDRTDAAAIWRQTSIPVIYRPNAREPILIKLPYERDNRDWLRGDGRRKPKWIAQYKCWEIPNSWFDDVVMRSLQRFGSFYVLQTHRAQDKCAPACWTAEGFDCECSCMGANHGPQNPAGKWWVVSKTCAVQWHGRQLACRLITSISRGYK
jgi:hypothetical protein